MDNRWRFLYCGVAELWGRMPEARAGAGAPGASAGGGGPEKPPAKPSARRGANHE